MTEQEFLEIVSLHAETWYKPAPQKKSRRDFYDFHSNGFGGLKRRSGKTLKDINLDDCLLVQWMTGGINGGSCWDDGERNLYSMEGEPEPTFSALDTILDQLCPNITYLQYRKLINDTSPSLVEYDSYTQNEYYGNSTTYGYKKVVLRRLWDRLNELGLI